MAEENGEALRRAFEEASDNENGASGRPADETVEILSFSLSGELHGFRLSDLVEIIGGVRPTPVPFTPDCIPGVINHRGTVVAVVDLKRVFGLKTGQRGERMVLVQAEGTTVSFEVDEISDILVQKIASIEPPLSTIEKRKADYIEGCIRLEQGLMVLLDTHALIHDLRATFVEAE